MASTSLGYEEKKAFEDTASQEQPNRASTIESRDTELQETEGPIEASESTENTLPPPPDGGLHAWLKVFGGFLVYINIWGFTLAYGAFQTYYQHNLLASSNASAISWIGTVQAWLLISIGVLSGPFFDIGYFRSMLFVGNFLVVFGIMMLSMCKEYWQVFLAQGLCMGLGAGLLYIPSLALVGIWFQRKRAIAMGSVMSGIAVGGVIYIIMFDRLVKSIGFPWAIRAMGFIAMACALLSFPALLSGSSILAHPRKARKLFDRTALKDRLFIIFTCSTFFNFLGYIVPYFYIAAFAQDRLGTSESKALYTLIASVAASFFGRVGCGFLAHHLGNIVTWGICSFACGVLSLSWISINDESTFIAFSVLWGFFSAALVTLPSAAFAAICPDLSRLGTRLGMSWAVSSIASLIGSPIAGALLKKNRDGSSDFLGVQLWSGICLLAGSGWLIVLWFAAKRKLAVGWRI